MWILEAPLVVCIQYKGNLLSAKEECISYTYLRSSISVCVKTQGVFSLLRHGYHSAACSQKTQGKGVSVIFME